MDVTGAATLHAIAGSSAPLVVETITNTEIPVVDFSLLVNGTPNQRSDIIRYIGEVCSEWGCFSLINHGVPEIVRSSMVEAFREFFDLTVEERKELMGKKIFDPIRHEAGLNTTAEGQQYWRDFVRIFVYPALHSPSKPPHFRAILEEYARHTREISIKLLNAIGESLGLEETYMEKMLDLTNGHQIVVGNRYPPIRSSEPAIGLPPHSDTPLLTLLLQHGAVDGLEVFHNGCYVPVRIVPGTFLVHSGDLLEIVSNGRYKSVLHKVMLKGESTRMSIVTAMGSSIETVVSPARKLVENAENVAAYRSMSYLEFVKITKNNQFGKIAVNLIKI